MRAGCFQHGCKHRVWVIGQCKGTVHFNDLQNKKENEESNNKTLNQVSSTNKLLQCYAKECQYLLVQSVFSGHTFIFSKSYTTLYSSFARLRVTVVCSEQPNVKSYKTDAGNIVNFVHKQYDNGITPSENYTRAWKK